jgi:nicotinamide riboside kinase
MRIRLHSFWPAVIWFVFATILFCLPGKALPERTWFNVIFLDKWIHIFLFTVLVTFIGLPFLESFMGKKKQFFIMLSVAMNCFLYGIVMEIVQYYFIPNRSFDLKDIVGDGVGCILGWYFIQYQIKKIGVKKICFYGPESTGKSTLATKLAEFYKTEYVPEVARELVTSNSFTVDDIIAIGKAQTERVLAKEKQANRLLFCDTDLITTQIYSHYYLKTVPPILYELEKQITYDHYFLFDIDVPWIADDLRDLGSDEQRNAMFETFKSALDKRKLSYTIINGTYAEREPKLRKMIDKIIS